MPKLKTHQGMAKRVKTTGSGKLLRRKASSNHNLSYKQSSTKRSHKKEYEVARGDEKNVKEMLGHKR